LIASTAYTFQKHGVLPSRFDTALVNDGTGEVTGAEGKSCVIAGVKRLVNPLAGYHICRVRVVFSLPTDALSVLFNPGVEVHKHLGYVQWYSPLTT
jgi:hypothetical protein